jgi:hypothetical protein
MNETIFDILIKRAGNHSKFSKELNVPKSNISWWSLNTDIKKNIHGIEILLNKGDEFEEKVIYNGKVLTVSYK